MGAVIPVLRRESGKVAHSPPVEMPVDSFRREVAQ